MLITDAVVTVTITLAAVSESDGIRLHRRDNYVSSTNVTLNICVDYTCPVDQIHTSTLFHVS
jgi:hypothetical protein